MADPAVARARVQSHQLVVESERALARLQVHVSTLRQLLGNIEAQDERKGTQRAQSNGSKGEGVDQ